MALNKISVEVDAIRLNAIMDGYVNLMQAHDVKVGNEAIIMLSSIIAMVYGNIKDVVSIEDFLESLNKNVIIFAELIEPAKEPV